MNKEFFDEIKDYSAEDLKLIMEDQGALYSAEEMAAIRARLAQLKAEKRGKMQNIETAMLAHLPKTIVCPKCEGPNEFSAPACIYCGCRLPKEGYYAEARRAAERQIEGAVREEEADEYDEEPQTEEKGPSFTFHYVISFLIPLVGFILGAMLLSDRDEARCQAGKACILWAIAGMVTASVLWVLLFV